MSRLASGTTDTDPSGDGVALALATVVLGGVDGADDMAAFVTVAEESVSAAESTLDGDGGVVWLRRARGT